MDTFDNHGRNVNDTTNILHDFVKTIIKYVIYNLDILGDLKSNKEYRGSSVLI